MALPLKKAWKLQLFENVAARGGKAVRSCNFLIISAALVDSVFLSQFKNAGFNLKSFEWFEGLPASISNLTIS